VFLVDPDEGEYRKSVAEPEKSKVNILLYCKFSITVSPKSLEEPCYEKEYDDVEKNR
jgi:hypothetical protein